MNSRDELSTYYSRVDEYFDDPEQRIHLKTGECLLEQEQFNDRLYLVISGELVTKYKNPEGNFCDVWISKKGKVLGVHSFFSQSHITFATVIAIEDAEIAYMDYPQSMTLEEQGRFYAKFMPIVISELSDRNKRIEQFANRREMAYRRLQAHQKLALLGHLSAGIAHELNNAISVLKSNVPWLIKFFKRNIEGTYSSFAHLFEMGLEKGRWLSTTEARKRSKQLRKKFDLSTNMAKKIAGTGISDEELAELGDIKKVSSELLDVWELGATFFDMRVAANQSHHVVKSVKSLSAKHLERVPDIDINGCVESALSLIHGKLKDIKVDVDLQPLPLLDANKGELVQVWMNLLSNAVESLVAAQTEGATIKVTSQHVWNLIVVKITDNGPGIPSEILPKIFLPDMTTKVSGLSFGLGLGLTFVQNIVEDYGGQVIVESEPGHTVFTVKIPLGGDHVNS